MFGIGDGENGNPAMDWLSRLSDLFGFGEPRSEIAAGEAVLRAVIIYLAVVAMLRLGAKRSMGRHTAFDLILAIMLGSVVSRGITGNAPMATSIAAGAALLALHWLGAVAAYHLNGVGWLIKGEHRRLVSDGELLEDQMRRSSISRRDLEEALRLKGVASLDRVQTVCLERSGQISVICRDGGEPRVVDVRVEDGVQTVRIELAPAGEGQ